MIWQLRRVRRQQIERDQRWLLLLTSGSAGGSAATKMWRVLTKELKQVDGGVVAEVAEECETPLSQADFERMMKEEH